LRVSENPWLRGRYQWESVVTLRSIVQRGAADNRYDIIQRCEYDVDPSVRFGNKSCGFARTTVAFLRHIENKRRMPGVLQPLLSNVPSVGKRRVITRPKGRSTRPSIHRLLGLQPSRCWVRIQQVGRAIGRSLAPGKSRRDHRLRSSDSWRRQGTRQRPPLAPPAMSSFSGPAARSAPG
jgi:hypothetical protein